MFVDNVQKMYLKQKHSRHGRDMIATATKPNITCISWAQLVTSGNNQDKEKSKKKKKQKIKSKIKY